MKDCEDFRPMRNHDEYCALSLMCKQIGMESTFVEYKSRHNCSRIKWFFIKLGFFKKLHTQYDYVCKGILLRK